MRKAATSGAKIERRIGASEFRGVLGIGPTWFNTMISKGLIPTGSVDPGGRRRWWTEGQVGDAINRLRRR